MRPISIPIRSEMPQTEDALDYMVMPSGMRTFRMPSVPEPGPGSDVAGARDVLRQFMTHLDAWLAEGAPAGAPPALDVARLQKDALRVLNETLGEGEVSAIVHAQHEVRVQETVFSGVWREQHIQGDVLLHDYLLAAAIPPIIGAVASERASPQLRDLPVPKGAMNVQSLVTELQEAMLRSGPQTPGHVVNLTLLPLSAEDIVHLDALLAGGTVAVLSRGFGNCRITSTAARNVWRVQYFNNMQTMILNSLEVTPMPEVAMAAHEDLLETRSRLDDLLQWMDQTVADA